MKRMQLKLSQVVPLSIVGVGIVSALVTGGITTYMEQQQNYADAMERLNTILALQATTLDHYLQSIVTDLRVQASSPMVRQALRDYHQAWQALPGGNPTQYLQMRYIDQNPHPTGQKEKLDAATDGTDYSRKHATYHPWFRTLLQQRGYYDVFLFNAKGDLVYTVFKERDFATNFYNGQWAATDLGRLFRQVASNRKNDAVVFFDFAPYKPSLDAPASFIGKRIVDEKGHFIGVLAFQMPIARMNAIMQNQTGLGKTGETYIVGKDRLLRSDSRFAKESTILKAQVDEELAAVMPNVAADGGHLELKNEQGQHILAAYRPLTFEGSQWLLVAQQTETELNEPFVRMQQHLLLQLGVITLLLVGVGVLLGRNIAIPITRMTQAMQALANGNTSVEIPAQERQDELGDMAKALQVFKHNAIAKTQLTDKLMQFANQLERQVKASIEIISLQIGRLNDAATQMASGAQSTSRGVQSVSLSSQEMSQTAGEISSQVSHTHVVAQRATEDGRRTADLMKQLADSAQHISDVIVLIKQITDQTNLLALNATIEASRAGEAGKGFAVVANEVKELAQQTAKATEEIVRQIQKVQTESEVSRQAIEAIAATIEQVNASSSSIAAAVEEQTASLHNISENLGYVANNTETFESNAAHVTESAAQLVDQMAVVNQEIDRFLEELRHTYTHH